MARTKFMLTGMYSAGGMFPAKTPHTTTKKSRSGKRKPKSGATRADKKKRRSGFYGSQMPREHKGPCDLKDGATVLVKWPDNRFVRGEVATVHAEKCILYEDEFEDFLLVDMYLVEEETVWKHENLDYDSEEDVEMGCFVKKDEYMSCPEDETDVHPRKPSKLHVPMAVIKEEPEEDGDFATTPVVNKDEKPLGRLAKAKAAAHLAMSTEEAKQNPLGAAAGLFDDHGDTRVEEDTPRKQASFSGPLTPQPASEHGDNKSDTFGDESEVEVEVDTEVETDGEVEGEDIAVEERRMIVEQEVAPVVQEKEEKKPFNWDERDLNIPSDEEAEEEDFDAALAAMEQQPYPPHWCTGIVH